MFMLLAVVHDYCIAQLSCTLCELDGLVLRSSFCRHAACFFSFWDIVGFVGLWMYSLVLGSSASMCSPHSSCSPSPTISHSPTVFVQMWWTGWKDKSSCGVASSAFPSVLHPSIPLPGILQLAELTHAVPRWKCPSWWTKSLDAGLEIRRGKRRSRELLALPEA